MSNYVNPMSLVAATPMTQQKSAKGGGTWFEAMAQAWGEALDNQAERDPAEVGRDQRRQRHAGRDHRPHGAVAEDELPVEQLAHLDLDGGLGARDDGPQAVTPRRRGRP